jgi:hypothetical protein
MEVHDETYSCFTELWVRELCLQVLQMIAPRPPRPPLPLPTANGREDGLVPDEGNFGLKDWRRVRIPTNETADTDDRNRRNIGRIACRRGRKVFLVAPGLQVYQV